MPASRARSNPERRSCSTPTGSRRRGATSAKRDVRREPASTRPSPERRAIPARHHRRDPRRRARIHGFGRPSRRSDAARSSATTHEGPLTPGERVVRRADPPGDRHGRARAPLLVHACGNCCTGPSGFRALHRRRGRAMARSSGHRSGRSAKPTRATRPSGARSPSAFGPHGYDCVFLRRDDEGKALCTRVRVSPGAVPVVALLAVEPAFASRVGRRGAGVPGYGHGGHARPGLHPGDARPGRDLIEDPRSRGSVNLGAQNTLGTRGWAQSSGTSSGHGRGDDLAELGARASW